MLRRIQRYCFVLLATAAALVLCARLSGSHLSHRSREGVVELAILSDLMGTLAPCGCTSRPLGGLDRLAASIDTRRQAGPLALLVVGDTFFPPPVGSVGSEALLAASADTIATLLGRLEPAAVAVGPRDHERLHAGDAAVAAKLAKNGSPAAWPALAPAASQMVRASGLSIGLIVASAGSDAEQVDGLARRLRADGAEGTVLLWPAGPTRARSHLAALEAVDLVVCGHDGAPLPPEPLGSAMLLVAGARGEHLGIVRLERDAAAGREARWQWSDDGRARRGPIVAQQRRLVAEAAALPAGPARAARLARAEALQQELDRPDEPRPAGIAVSWQPVPIEATLPAAAWASALLLANNDAMCGPALADTGRRVCSEADDAASRYVGSAECAACHAAAWQVWQGTAHAHAWATLTKAHKSCDLSCVGCHVVGWEAKGGFCHLGDAEAFQNVGCESCHGPASGHIAAPTERNRWSGQFVRNPPEATCRTCHTEDHSDKFDFATYRPKVLGPGHGA